jgi:CIC family chloride channel protein
MLAGLAAVTPQTLGAGHGALALDLPNAMPSGRLAQLIGLKLCASMISLASGFRGGMFFSSLFVGALLGKLYAIGVATFLPFVGLDPTASAFAGMATFGSAIVGGPLTMAFLVLESSGDVGLAGPVLAGCVASHLTVKAIFGYSFSTWRLHLRGEDILGAQDVGWVRTLRGADMMDRNVPQFAAQATLAEFRLDYPLGGPAFVALTDAQGRYAGLVSTAEAHAEGERDETLARFARMESVTLSPEQNIQQALETFAVAESEVLAVVDSQREVVGTLREAYVARRYAAAVEQASAGVLGGA